MLKKIISNIEISSGIYKMVLEWEEKAFPGQFVMLNCGGRTLLKRPMSICDIDKKILTIVYQLKGEGTKNLSKMKPGDSIEITGPHGHGFDIFENKKILIVGGGVGIPPLLYLTKELKSEKIYIALGFRSEIYLIDEFKKYGEVFIATEDGSHGKCGYVTDLIKDIIDDIDIIYGCGPKPMLKALKEMAIKAKKPCQISVEERMGCGIGACMVCACKIKDKDNFHYKKVCKDGPVFWAEEVEI
ncbi:MAG: dihydroorotate dehydrogenase electron transfer subunit [Thermoanaerobacteraceae bacterium]|nr:dihydroorotate dehydrogenase electron transfer subunit [Thermoanaerobacteraceae bacterium]